MPTYEYVCEACDHELELFQPMTEAPKRKCPTCGKLKLVRKISGGAGILFRGTGFYQTDYRSESYKKGAEQAKESAKASSESSKGDKGDKKTGSGDKPASKNSGPSKSKGD